MEDKKFGYCSICKGSNKLLLSPTQVQELGFEKNTPVCIGCQLKILLEVEKGGKK